MPEEERPVTIATQDLINISMTSNENLQSLKDIYEFHKSEVFEIPEHVFYLLCEMMWLESSLLLLLRRDMSEPEFHDKQQKEVLISEVTLKSLMTLSIAKLQAERDLNDFGFSLGLH
jgi:hypothetical protein|tara:strand:- start:484 stop:834 length:351 start_codon:yes stop_codon:yes gene_type:complete